jgi:polyisoprenoid-binding protein YceI
MNHTLHSWTGLSNDVTSIIVTDNQKQTITTVTIAVNVSSFDSKNSFRDSRMMKVTEALKFPKITFSSTAIKHTNNKVMVEGLLSFHGITKPITLEAISKQSNNMLKVTGTFIINMKDFNIDPPRLLGIATDDVIKLTFSIVY